MSPQSIRELSLPLSIALSLASLGLGYVLGTLKSQPQPPSAPGPSDPTSSTTLTSSTTSQTAPTPGPTAASTPSSSWIIEDDTDDEDETLADGDLSAIKAGLTEHCKMVLVVRTDLGMSTGKIAAQCGHATLACYKALIKTNPGLVRHWERTGQAKIALKASSEDQLLELEAIAKSLNLCARSILDAGRTQIAAGSRTVLAIGPAPIPIINQVTGHLRLL
ncbi:peptidyl-tRNA hydrolase 2 [Coprinopsis cinerea AmutBmut pab1-1]|nr:peptidyl-tRNA hydrolase 2 [Coprinopsis cinerea AmutBmut pab1-1]